MNFKSYNLRQICSMVKGEYSIKKTKPGQYPLVVTAIDRRTANSYQIDGPAVCIPIVSLRDMVMLLSKGFIIRKESLL